MRSRLWNTMRPQRLAHLWAQHQRFAGTSLGEAYYVAFKRATGYIR